LQRTASRKRRFFVYISLKEAKRRNWVSFDEKKRFLLKYAKSA